MTARSRGASSSVKAAGQEGGTATWFRTHHEDEDPWPYFGTDDEGRATRQAEVRGRDPRPVAATPHGATVLVAARGEWW